MAPGVGWLPPQWSYLWTGTALEFLDLTNNALYATETFNGPGNLPPAWSGNGSFNPSIFLGVLSSTTPFCNLPTEDLTGYQDMNPGAGE